MGFKIKTLEFYKKQKRSFIFLFIVFNLIFISRTLFVFQNGIGSDKITVSIDGVTNQDTSTYNVSRVSIWGTSSKLSHETDSLYWYLDKSWAKAICITFPTQNIKLIETIHVTIGEKQFNLDKNTILKNSIHNGLSNYIFTTPSHIRSSNFRIPGFNIINCNSYYYLIIYGLFISLFFTFIIAYVVVHLNNGFTYFNDFTPHCNTPFYVYLLVFGLTVIVSSTFAIIGIDAYHDGVIFKPASDIIEGKLLYKNTFTQYGGITILIQAFSMFLFGKYIVVTKLCTCVFYGFIAVLLFTISKRYLPITLSLLSWIIWLLLAPYYIELFQAWSSVYSLFFQLLSLYLLIKYFETEKVTFLFISGITVSLTILSRQNVGVFLTIASLFVLAITSANISDKKIKRIKNILIFLAGIISCFFVFLMYLLITHSLNDWYIQTIEFSYRWVKLLGGGTFLFPGTGSLKLIYEHIFIVLLGSHYSQFDYPIKLLGSLLLIYNFFNISILWRIIPIIVVIISFCYCIDIFLKRNCNKKNRILFVITVISLSSWLQYYPVTCIRHVYWSAAPMIGLVVFFIANISFLIQHKLLRYSILSIFILFIFGNDIVFRIKSGYTKLYKSYNEDTTIQEPQILKGIRLPKIQAKDFEILNHDLKWYNPPNTSVINISFYALHCSILKKNKNFHPLYGYTSVVYPNFKKEMLSYINKHRPLIISVWKTCDGWPWDTLPRVNGYKIISKFNDGSCTMVPISKGIITIDNLPDYKD